MPNACERIVQQAENGIAFSGIDKNGDIIAIGGIAIPWQGVGAGWVLTSELLLKHKIWTHRKIRDIIMLAEDAYNLHRIETVILKDHKVSMKWAERLGFKKEGLLRKYNSNKQDHWIYARVR